MNLKSISGGIKSKECDNLRCDFISDMLRYFDPNGKLNKEIVGMVLKIGATTLAISLIDCPKSKTAKFSEFDINRLYSSTKQFLGKEGPNISTELMAEELYGKYCK